MQKQISNHIESSDSAKVKYKKDEHVGIYKIELEHLKRVYIGQSINVPTRLRNHKMNLKNGSYSLNGSTGMRLLNDDFSKFGVSSFKFEQIHICEHDDLHEWETYYCKLYNTEGYDLYNSFINTQLTGLMCPEEFKPIITKLINMLDNGKVKKEQLEQAIYQIENY